MKVKLNALNKDYLVEFKNDEEFVKFATLHNDKIKNIEIINEDTLPQLEKPVELAKPSKSDGWKALEKSAFTTKEKNVNKKSMDLGGKYSEFKYEPDKSLASQCDDKVSDPKNDSPALKGEEPKVKDVEATAKENEVEVKDAPKSETPSEPKKEETSEPKTEDKAEDKSEKEDDKEEKKETVEESARNFDDNGLWNKKCNIGDRIQFSYPDDSEGARVGTITKVEYDDKDRQCDWYEVQFRDGSTGEVLGRDIDKVIKKAKPVQESVKNDDYQRGYEDGQDSYKSGHYIPEDESDPDTPDYFEGYDDGFEDAKNGINKFGEYNDPFAEEEYVGDLEEVFKSAGMEINEAIKDYLPRTGFIRDDDEDKDSRKVGAYLAQGTDDQLRKAKIIAKVKFMNGDRFGRVTKDDLEHFDEYKKQYDEYFGSDEVEEGADQVGIERNPYKGDDLVSYAKSTTWTPGDKVEESADDYKYGDKTFNDMLEDFANGKCTLKEIRKYMEENGIDPKSADIQRLIKRTEDKSGIQIPLNEEDGSKPYSDDKEQRLTDATSIWLIDGSGSIEIKAPYSLVQKVAQSGDNGPAVDELRKSVQSDIAKYSDDELKDLIADYGVEDVDTMDRETLENYTLWTLAWDAIERDNQEDLEEGTKESFKGEYADTDSEVEADAENKPSEEFKAELEKHGKLKGDGTDKIDAQDPDVPSGNVKVKVYDIEWDCDSADPDECGLPDELELEINHDADFRLDDEISDELTKSTGFCHYGFKYDLV